MEGITLNALNEKLQQGNLDPRELEKATKYQKTAFPTGGSYLLQWSSWTLLTYDIEYLPRCIYFFG
jgi:hypothetical protein